MRRFIDVDNKHTTGIAKCNVEFCRWNACGPLMSSICSTVVDGCCNSILDLDSMRQLLQALAAQNSNQPTAASIERAVGAMIMNFRPTFCEPALLPTWPTSRCWPVRK